MGYLIAFALLVLVGLGWLSFFLHRTFVNPAPTPRDQQYVMRLLQGLVILSLLIAFLPAAAYQLGQDTRQQYDAAYFAQHYANPGLPQWKRTTGAPRQAPLPRSFRAGGYPDLTRYWGGGDQGAIGECAGWSAAKAYTYAFRLLHPDHPGIRFSPQWFYDYYSDLYSRGQDLGSVQSDDLQVVALDGAVQYRKYPSAVPVTYPFPTAATYPALFTNAAAHRSPIQVKTLYWGNPSAAVYDEIKAALASGQIAMLALDVTPSFDAATVNGGRAWYPGAEGNRGGHAVNGIQVDDTMKFAEDGSIGGIRMDNQWLHWGVNNTAWFSRRWVNAHVWGVMVITGGVSAHTKG